MSEIAILWTWQGREVEVRAKMLPSEPEVGIMRCGPETIRLTDMDGAPIALTEAEEDALLKDEALADALETEYESSSDYDYE